MAASTLRYAILALFLTQIVVAPKQGSTAHPKTWFVCEIMGRIAEIFRERLQDINTSQNTTQFAVLALIPQHVQISDHIDYFMSSQFEGINFYFARPTWLPNQNCRTHAEVLLLGGLNQLYAAFIEEHRCPPQFAVLYTWIHPCLDCTKEIIDIFGDDHIPVWSIETYIGHTTQGNKLIPPLTEKDRSAIKNMLKEVGLNLYRIKVGITLHRYNHGKTE